MLTSDASFSNLKMLHLESEVAGSNAKAQLNWGKIKKNEIK